MEYEETKIYKVIEQVKKLNKYIWFATLAMGVIAIKAFDVTGCYDNVLHMAGCTYQGKDISKYVNYVIWFQIFGLCVIWPLLALLGHPVGLIIHYVKDKSKNT